MKRTIAITIVAVAFTALNVWHATVEAQRTTTHKANVVVLGTDMDITNATNPQLRITDTTNTVQLDMQALDTSGELGTTSNHPLYLMTNETVRLWIEAAGNIGIGTVSPAVGLHGVVPNGTLLWGDGEADNTAKNSFLGIEHYDVDEEPFYALNPATANGTNALFLGGGWVGGNAATFISFLTAANSTTLTGTERAQIDSNGYFYFTDRLVDLGDTNTYVLSSGTDEIMIYTGGTIRASFSAAAIQLSNAPVIISSYMILPEGADPGGGINQVRMWARDNGGTTEVCFDFPGGDTLCPHVDPNP